MSARADAPADALADAPLARQAGTALAWRAGGMLGGKLVSLGRYLVLAHLLAPGDIGLFAIALVPLDLLVTVTDVGVIPALVQRAAPTARDYDVAWTVGLARAIVVAVLLLAAAPLLAGLLDEPRATPFLRVLALRPLIGAAASIRVADLERRLLFRPLALIDTPAALAGAIVSITLAPAVGAWALVAGTLAGALVGLALSYVLAPHRPRLVFDRAAARPLLRYGRWVLVGGVLAALADAALRAVISRRLGTPAVGLYFLAASLATLASGAVAALVGAVAFPLHARLQSDVVRAGSAFRATLLGTAMVLAPVYAVLIALAPPLARYALGAPWLGAAPVVRILALAALLGIVFDAAAPMLQGRGRPQLVAALHAIVAATTIPIAWLLAGRYGVTGAALAWLVAQSVTFVAGVVFVHEMLPRPFAGLLRPLLAVFTVSAAAAAAAWALHAAVPGIVGLAAGIVLAALIAASLLAVLDRRLDLGLARDFTRSFPAVAARLRLVPRGS